MVNHLLICGLGSIGFRHLRHFRTLGVERIDALRSGKATVPDEGQPQPDRVYHSLEKALAERPDAVIIATPTSLHVPMALAAVRVGANVLVEKPLSHTLEGCQELADEAKRRGVVVTVAQNLRFHPSLRVLRNMVQQKETLGEVLMARAHFGTYLPDWHPWEDYRISYAARRDLGGGAVLTHMHEIDIILWMFGPVEAVCGMEMGLKPLGTNVDEASVIVARHTNGMLSIVTLSLAQKPASRTLDIAGTRGTAHLDLLTGCWEIRLANGLNETGAPPAGFELDHTYRDQAAAFLSAIRREAPPAVGMEEAIQALKFALFERNYDTA